MSAASSERFDGLPAATYLPSIATIPGFPPVLSRPLPRRDRSVLHAAETLAYRGDARSALAWFLATDIPAPIDWLARIVTAWAPRITEPREFYGHAIRLAAATENADALRDIARCAAPVDAQMADLAALAAEGVIDAVRDAERLMRTVRIDLGRVDLPSAADLDALPQTLPRPALLPRMNHLISRSRLEEPPMAFQSLAEAACAYPLIYEGSALLNAGKPTWGWRYFEAAEQLRDMCSARDA